MSIDLQKKYSSMKFDVCALVTRYKMFNQVAAILYTTIMRAKYGIYIRRQLHIKPFSYLKEVQKDTNEHYLKDLIFSEI